MRRRWMIGLLKTVEPEMLDKGSPFLFHGDTLQGLPAGPLIGLLPHRYYNRKLQLLHLTAEGSALFAARIFWSGPGAGKPQIATTPSRRMPRSTSALPRAY